MKELLPQLLPQVIELIVPIIMALGALLSLQITNWIKAKTQNETAQGALIRLNELVATQVRANAQTIVASLREAAGDGSVDADELARIKDETIQRLKTYLGQRGLKDLAKVIDGETLDTFLEAKVEQAVHQLKEAA